MKSGHWFLPARKPIARDLGPCAGCDAPATGWDARANAYCCDTCRVNVEIPTRPFCRCAFTASQRRVLEGAA